jgi:hypothetical protein
MLLYKGEATDPADMEPEAAQEVMGKWAAWMESVGPALADLGTPMGDAATVVDDASAGTPLALSGYTIVEADDIDGARALTEGHPYLSDGTGDFAIDIHELLPVPDMG